MSRQPALKADARASPAVAPGWRPATAEDIATAAGVSVASVSRVLNNTGRVGAATRERILKLAAELHYAPNAAARSLASRRSRTVGAVIPSLENLNFAIGIDRFRKALREQGYTLLLASCDYDKDKEEAQIRAMAAHGVDAVMLIGLSHNAQALRLPGGAPHPGLADLESAARRSGPSRKPAPCPASVSIILRPPATRPGTCSTWATSGWV